MGDDGDVLEITFTTVKIQNFNNTITTIPIYSIINEYFKNWRNKNLSGSGGIKILANIKNLDSIKFSTREMLERFKHIQLVSDEIKKAKRKFQSMMRKIKLMKAYWSMA